MCLIIGLNSQFPHSDTTKKPSKIIELCSYHPPAQSSLSKQILQVAMEVCQETSEFLIPSVLFIFFREKKTPPNILRLSQL